LSQPPMWSGARSRRRAPRTSPPATAAPRAHRATRRSLPWPPRETRSGAAQYCCDTLDCNYASADVPEDSAALA
jgi:hypothetical protein